MSRQPKTFLTPEEYLDIERKSETRSEYYNGEMFAMSGGTREHSVITMNLAAMIYNRRRPRCLSFAADTRVRIPATGLYTYPDVCLACDARFEGPSRDVLTNPVLVIEVLSTSTENYDRGPKFDHYRRLESLQQYVLVWQTEPRLQIYTRRQDGPWLFTETVGLTAAVELIGVESPITLAEIYRDVQLPETPPPLPR